MSKQYHFSKKQIKDICKQYVSGNFIADIARQYEVDPCVIRKRLKDHQIKLRPINYSECAKKYIKNESIFNEPLTENAAYWIGFLMADGCVYQESKNRNVVILSAHTKDRKHIEKFRDFVSPQQPIKVVQEYKTSYGVTSVANIHISSTPISNILKKYGVVPKKSLVAKAQNGIENNRNFWRGVVDGDGTLTYNTHKKRHGKILSSPAVYPSLELCGSKEICQQYLRYCKNKAGITTCTKIKPIKSIFRVRLVGKPAYMMIKHLYSPALESLNRKQKIANDILKKFALRYES